MNEKMQKRITLVWLAGVFVFMYIWFSQIHPLVVYDADDWTYLTYSRLALPMAGEWNPAKVFPEVAMPLVSAVAYYGVMPLLGDYLHAFTVVHALVVSGFVTLYMWCFSGLLRRSFQIKGLTNAVLSALFLIFHFLVFRGKEEANLYMFHCVDLNCYYNYLIPALIGASCVMYMMGNEKWDAFLKTGSMEMKGAACFVLYFAVFSNLTASGILAAYAGCVLLVKLLQVRKHFRLKDYVQENGAYLLILAVWFVSAAFELTGGRAVEAVENVSFFQQLKHSVYFLKEVIYAGSRVFWGVVAGIVALTVFWFAWSRGRGEAEKQFLPVAVACLIAGGAMLVYTLLLCTVVNPLYMLRSEYLFGIFFYGLLMVLLAAAYLVNRRPRLLLVLPILVAVLLSCVNTPGRTFHESNKFNVDADICEAISQDILDQVIAADQAGQKEMILYVPYHVADPETQDNWPHTLVLMHRLAGVLYEHGITNDYIYIVDVQASEEMNQRYGLAMPEE